MTTAKVEFDFPNQIKETRKKIRESFKKTHEILQVRESYLLSRIDEIIKDYDTKMQELSENFRTLTVFNSGSRKSKKKSTNKQMNSTVDDKIEQLNAEIERSIEFEWDFDLDAKIEQLGSIVLNSQIIVPSSNTFPPGVKPIVPDYDEKCFPTKYLMCEECTKKEAYKKFSEPTSIAIHYRTGDIYIGDMGKDRVQVFNRDGDFLFMFNEKMNQPRGICISSNKVYVTQFDGHCINLYELDGTLIKRVGSKGDGRAQFNHPMGLDYCRRTKIIYVCDRFNDRVQVMTNNAECRCMLGKDLLDEPQDVKVAWDRIFVLDKSDLCIFVFNSDHHLINRMITRGDGEQTSKPYCFDIDRDYNIIMTDSCNNRVYIFNEDGHKIHKFGQKGEDIGDFYHPYGVALDNIGRIIVICEKYANCLQFF